MLDLRKEHTEQYMEKVKGMAKSVGFTVSNIVFVHVHVHCTSQLDYCKVLLSYVHVHFYNIVVCHLFTMIILFLRILQCTCIHSLITLV